MCAIAGAFNVPKASYIIRQMLYALNHRGREGAGDVSCEQLPDGTSVFHEHRGVGVVDEVFRDMDFEKELPGSCAVGHTRYSTAKGSAFQLESLQPFTSVIRGTPVAIVHNGNLTDYQDVRPEFERKGAVYRSNSDTEHFLHLMARAEGSTFDERLMHALQQPRGAWSLVIMTPDAMYAVTDPYGMRPLSMADYQGGHVFASETCAFDLLGVRPSLTLPRGTVLKMTRNGFTVQRMPNMADFGRGCAFEFGYFSMPDSYPFGMSAHAVRERLGRLLAETAPVAADFVCSVPDSANAMATAYARAVGLPKEDALLRNHQAGRTFISPTHKAREFGVRMKLKAVRELVEGKRVCVVDDSIVRGITTKHIVELLRQHGAKEVHFRIGMPPVISPCLWGIDTPDAKDLIAANLTRPDLKRYIGADSLAYATVEQFRQALQDEQQEKYCLTCFTGRPPEEQFVPEGRLTRR